jgi:hypothetical protein
MVSPIKILPGSTQAMLALTQTEKQYPHENSSPKKLLYLAAFDLTGKKRLDSTTISVAASAAIAAATQIRIV